MRQPVTITEGRPGSGKTFSRCAYFLTQFFIPEEGGVHLSNFPIFKLHKKPEFEGETYVDRIASYCEKRWKIPKDHTYQRIQQLPKEVEASWREDITEGGSGPWDFFAGKDVTGMHVAIDEAHTVIGRKHSAKHKKAWQDFLGEVRHMGMTWEFITQDLAKLATEVEQHAGTVLSLVDASQCVVPFFNIAIDDLLELLACYVFRQYVGICWEVQHRRDKGKWIPERAPYAFMWPFFFQFYDSHDAPKSGLLAAVHPPKRAWEEYGPIYLPGWFCRKNFLQVVIPITIAGVFVYLGPMGGAEAWAKEYFAQLEHLGKQAGTSLKRAKDEAHESVHGRAAAARPQSVRPNAKQVSVEHGDGGRGRPAAGPGQPNRLPEPVSLADVVDVDGVRQVCGVIPGGVLVVGGWSVVVGESITDGGSKLDAVNHVRGTFTVAGRVHSLRDAARQRADADSLRGTVSGGVAAVGAERSDGQRSDIAAGGRNAAPVAPVVPRPAGRRLDRVGTVVGREPDHAIRPQRESPGSVAAGSAPMLD